MEANFTSKPGSKRSGVRTSSPQVSSSNILRRLPPNCILRQARTNSLNCRAPSLFESISCQAYSNLPNFFNIACLNAFALEGGGDKEKDRCNLRCTSPSVCEDPASKSEPELRRESLDQERFSSSLDAERFSKRAGKSGDNFSDVKISLPPESSSKICRRLPWKCMLRHARTNSLNCNTLSPFKSITSQARSNVPNFFSSACLNARAVDGGGDRELGR